jgi:hypothetical protein
MRTQHTHVLAIGYYWTIFLESWEYHGGWKRCHPESNDFARREAFCHFACFTIRASQTWALSDCPQILRHQDELEEENQKLQLIITMRKWNVNVQQQDVIIS